MIKFNPLDLFADPFVGHIYGEASRILVHCIGLSRHFMMKHCFYVRCVELYHC